MVKLMEFKRSKNYYLTIRKFISFATWKDPSDMFVIIPTIMCKRKQDRGLEVVLSQYIFAWGRRKFEMDIGNYYPRHHDYSWKGLKMDTFLDWAKKNIDNTLTKEYIEIVLEDNQGLKKTLSQTSPNFHYMKLLLGNEIKKFKQLSDISPEMVKNGENMSPEEQALKNALDNDLDGVDLLDQLSTVVQEEKRNR